MTKLRLIGPTATYPLVKSPAIVGRSNTADVRIDDGFASREHARLEWSDGAWWLTDLGSANGTFVNGTRVSGKIRLSGNDQIQIGNTQFFVSLSESTQVVAKATPGPNTQKPFHAKAIPSPGVNSCPSCQGAQVCPKCDGVGKKSLPDKTVWVCGNCSGKGSCPTCVDHVKKMLEVIDNAQAGQISLAEATVMRHLGGTNDEEIAHRSNAALTGAGVGGAVGALFGPLGVLAGVTIGRALADDYAREAAPEAVGWKRADLLTLYAAILQSQGRTEEARQALVKAVAVCPKHGPANKILENR